MPEELTPPPWLPHLITVTPDGDLYRWTCKCGARGEPCAAVRRARDMGETHARRARQGLPPQWRRRPRSRSRTNQTKKVASHVNPNSKILTTADLETVRGGLAIKRETVATLGSDGASGCPTGTCSTGDTTTTAAPAAGPVNPLCPYSDPDTTIHR